ncbi:MAG: SDR family NAD(P)-dependent oxidoreductase [SAR324 cluster bacterium]|nr:SDR family NAD(P)-dependent oxidoreductase [SAR324 cluster bacterium]
MRVIFEVMDDVLNKTVLFGYDRIGYAIRKKLWNDTETQVPMNDKVCVITGANSGLGKAASLHLARLGASVYLVCRNPESGEAARQEIMDLSGNTQVFLELVDMSEPQQIKAFAERFDPMENRLDILINNAGVLLNTRNENSEGIEKTFATNTLGYFLMTNWMLPYLQKSKAARIINVSSGGMYPAAVQLEDPQYLKRPYNGVNAYAESKRAEVILSEIWAHDLKENNIMVSAMHPGWADTRGVQNSLPTFHKITQTILRTPEQGADTIIWLAVNPHLTKQDSGKFWFDRKPRSIHRSRKTQHTNEQAQMLWDLCCECGHWHESCSNRTTPVA